MNAVSGQPSIVTITHLEILEAPFRHAARNGSHFRPEREGPYIVPIKPDYKKFLRAVKKIGDEWHKREEHQEPLKAQTKKVLEGKDSRMWSLMKGKKEIGFCCAVRGGFPGLSDKFNLGAKNQTEVFKIGLYPAFQKQGFGQVLIPAILDEILESSEGVYLNTRDSNKVNSVPIYEELGMKVIHQEHIVDGKLPDGIAVKLVAMCTKSGKDLGPAQEVLEARFAM